MKSAAINLDLWAYYLLYADLHPLRYIPSSGIAGPYSSFNFTVFEVSPY
jgi:hypothetical protein